MTYLLMSPPLPPDFFLCHVLFPDSMSCFGGAAVNAAAIPPKFAAAAKIDEEFDGVVEIEEKMRHFKAKVE